MKIKLLRILVTKSTEKLVFTKKHVGMSLEKGKGEMAKDENDILLRSMGRQRRKGREKGKKAKNV